MAEEDTKQSRRARRRAEQAKAEAEERDDDALEEEEERDDDEAEEPAAEADAEDDDESDDDEGDDDSAPVVDAGDDEDDDEDEERAAKPAASSKKKKKKKKRASDDDSPEDIKDRNKRLRAAAVARRRAKREREVAAAQGLDAGEMVDDALARGTHAATTWVKKNFNVVQWVVIAALVGGIGWQIYSWRKNKTEEKASDTLITGVEAELGRVGAPQITPPGMPEDDRPNFATAQERLDAAKKAYEEAANIDKGSGTAILAKLGLAGVQYDSAKYDEAKTSYEEVKTSALAKHDDDVLGRSIEGIGLSLEAKGDTDGALSAFKELQGTSGEGFKALGLYHEARLAAAAGKNDKAKELLGKVKEQMSKDKSAYGNESYLERASQDLLGVVDPSQARKPSAAGYTPEQIDELKEQILKDPRKLQKMLEDMGKGAKDLGKQVEDAQKMLPKVPPPAPSGAP